MENLTDEEFIEQTECCHADIFGDNEDDRQECIKHISCNEYPYYY